jgi:hypothetical protein
LVEVSAGVPQQAPLSCGSQQVSKVVAEQQGAAGVVASSAVGVVVVMVIILSFRKQLIWGDVTAWRWMHPGLAD